MSSKDRDIASFRWQDHVSLLVGGATAALVALKIFAVAHWNLNTAFGILVETGTANVLTGSLLALLPAISVMTLTAFSRWVDEGNGTRTKPEQVAVEVLYIVGLLILIQLAPAIYFLTWVTVQGVVGIVRAVRNRSRKRRESSAANKSKGWTLTHYESLKVMAASAIVMLVGTLSVPWLPSQVAEHQGNETTVYVLNAADEKATVLLDRGRSIVKLKEDDLTEEYCRHRLSWLNEPLFAWAASFAGDSTYRNCPHNT